MWVEHVGFQSEAIVEQYTIQVTVRGDQWLEGIVSRILQGYPDSTKCGGNTSRVGEEFQVGSESDVKALLG